MTVFHHAPIIRPGLPPSFVAALVVGVAAQACAPKATSSRAERPEPALAAPATSVGAADSAPAAPVARVAPLALALAPSVLDSPVHIEADDAQIGASDAPVTLVEFSDLECPFCARAQPTIDALEKRYGPAELRIVWKHYPLPFHPHARAAAVAARAVFELGGAHAFFGYIDALFADQSALEDAQLARTAAAFGIDPARFAERFASDAVANRVAKDVALGEHLGVEGTPHFFVNGIGVSGAVPLEELAAPIDRELALAAEMRAQGVPASEISARLTRTNFRPPPPSAGEVAEAPDTTVWFVPLEKSPATGAKDARVTIVEFGDFQCPFCKHVQPTLAALREHYGQDVRLVFKHLPLPFHPRARAAATFAIEAGKAQGDAGFFKAVGALYARAPRLENSDLKAIARELGLDWPKIEGAISGDADARTIDHDMNLARDLGATGVPHFFVNGRRLVGAQPLEVFTAATDRALADADELLRTKHVSRSALYPEIMRTARGAPGRP